MNLTTISPAALAALRPGLDDLPAAFQAAGPLLVPGGEGLPADDDGRGVAVVLAGLLEGLDEDGVRVAWAGPGDAVGVLSALVGRPEPLRWRAWRSSVVAFAPAAVAPDLLRRIGPVRGGLERTGDRPGPWILGLVLGDGASLSTVLGALAFLPEGCGLWPGGDDADDPALLAAGIDRRGRGLQVLLLLANAGDTTWRDGVLDAADHTGWLGAEGPPTLSGRGVERLAWEGRKGGGDSGSLVRPGVPSDLTHWVEETLAARANPALLARFRLFEGIEVPALSGAIERMSWRSVSGGEQVFSAGDPADALYLVRSGRLRISVDTPDGPVRVTDLGPGDSLGELALLTGRPRSATAHALRDTELARLAPADFVALRRALPRLGDNLAGVLTDMVDRQVGHDVAPATLTVVRLEEEARCVTFGRRLVEALQAEGLVVERVDEAVLTQRFGPLGNRLERGRPGHAGVVRWLQLLEERCDVVVYECGASDEAWSQLCLRQGDRVAGVAPSAASPGLRHLERVQGSQALGRGLTDLVLLQPAGINAARGTAAWLDPRPEARVHHVRDAAPADLGAAARRLVDRAVGASLAGASTRGPAHAGTLRAMEHLGLPVDIISGTSSGAGLAAYYAEGVGVERVLEGAVSIVEKIGLRLSDLQPPYTALSSGARLDALFHGVLGDACAEDLLIPCRLSAVDLRTHGLVWLDRGPLWRNVRASSNLPVIWPPVAMEGRILVDGGLLSYMPIEGALPRCHQGVVVSSVLANANLDVPFAGVEDYGTVLSGWAQLGDRLSGRAPEARWPGLVDVLFNAMVIGGVERDARRRPSPAVCEVRSAFGADGLFSVTIELAREMEQLTFERGVEQISAWMAENPARWRGRSWSGGVAAQAASRFDPSSSTATSEAASPVNSSR